MKAIMLNPNDNVATAIVDIPAGSLLEVQVDGRVRTVRTVQDIPRGHKLALTVLRKGESVIKYGEVIGVTMNVIDEGEHVHVHNVASRRGRGDLVRKR